MSSRKFKERYTSLSEIEKDIKNAYKIAERMIVQIDFYLQNEKLEEETKNKLKKWKDLIQKILEKYRNFNHNFFNDLKADFDIIFEIEDKIYKEITIKLWHDYMTPVEKSISNGEYFAYLVHYGHDIVVNHMEGDFISATLSTSEKFGTFHGKKVGLILESERYNMFTIK